MLFEQFLLLWLAALVTSATTRSKSDSINPLTENTEDNERKLQKRQYPWALPQGFPNLAYWPTHTRESWRYYPCRSYPSFPPYQPPPSLPPSTPPSSPADDPNDIIDRMGGGPGQKKNKEEPSRCVWAIVACCSPGSRDIRYSCFELLGCPGAFWDVNPCEEKVAMAAANTALNFYSGKNNTETTTSTPT